MSYIVKASHYQSQEKIFEGPLDLLLELIEKEKLDITEVSLAQVANQFLEYLETAQGISPENLADFLLIGGKLILIKSKAILPMLELEKEEEEDIEELKARLREYQKFKEISKKIKALAIRREMFFSKQSYSGMRMVFCPPKKITTLDLQEALEGVLNKLPKAENLAKRTMKDIVSIKDKIKHIKENLTKRIEMTFTEATHGTKDKIEVIITFLAMLELVRKSMVTIEQNDMFGEIKIKKSS
ncbi:segregation/condensation protein A [Candidatus Parcubacteria bacterium]|nr:segregation/condensation protein A [Candidatus Parcubacteria bacterium]